MTRTEVATMIAGIDVPDAYDHFKREEAPDGPPFICFYYPNEAGFRADDVNYAQIARLVIELYTDNIDFTLEANVEEALNAAELPFVTSRDWIDDEQMYQTTYETSVLLTEDKTTDENENTEVSPTNDEQQG